MHIVCHVFSTRIHYFSQTEQLTQFQSDKASHAAELEAAQKRSQVSNHAVVVKFSEEFNVGVASHRQRFKGEGRSSAPKGR